MIFFQLYLALFMWFPLLFTQLYHRKHILRSLDITWESSNNIHLRAFPQNTAKIFCYIIPQHKCSSEAGI